MSNEGEDDGQCCLDDELETLRSIYLNELEVLCDKGGPIIAVQLHPSTADNVDEQYVRMSLILDLPAGYPDIVPDIHVKNPRGLSDEKLQRIIDDLFSKAKKRKGSPMLFELIECAKDHLTAGNRPSCQCAICLYGFTEQDVFTKTKCYHYFHSHCLARYVTHQLQEFDTDHPVEKCDAEEKEIFCPVCRVPISFVIPVDSDFPPPSSAIDDSFTITDELKHLQNKMADLYKKQRDKGGIIDVEAEKKKFLLEISSVPTKTQPIPEVEQPNSMQSSTLEEIQCDLSQQKKDLILPRNKISDKTQNSVSASKQTANWYQKGNRRGKDSNYTPSKNFSSMNNKSQKMKKSYMGPDEEHYKKCLIQGHEDENCTDAKSVARNYMAKGKAQENDETQKVASPEFGKCVDHGLSSNESDTTHIYSTSSRVDCIQSKYHHVDGTHPRPSYHKRCRNCNHHNFCKQCVNDNGEKHFSVTRGSPFGTDINLSNRRSDDNNKQHRRGDNYHQMRITGSYSKKAQNEENYLKQSGRRGNYHGNKQHDEFMFRCKQNGNSNKSRQNFHRTFRYNSRFEQYNSVQQELSRSCDTKRADCGALKDYNIQAASLVQNVEDNLDEVDVESFHQPSKIYGNMNRRNYCSSRRTDKLHEHNRYQNKYEDLPRNSNNSFMESQSSSHLLQESCASKNVGESISPEGTQTVSPDRCPKHPFRNPCGKKSGETHSSSSPIEQEGSVLKVHKIQDDSIPVFENSSNYNENFSPVIDSFSHQEVKKSNLALRNADAIHPVSRPPPGFAKKVVYGLPSVKPPPGFSQS